MGPISDGLAPQRIQSKHQGKDGKEFNSKLVAHKTLLRFAKKVVESPRRNETVPGWCALLS